MSSVAEVRRCWRNYTKMAVERVNLEAETDYGAADLVALIDLVS